jgi:DNA-binding NarL/FixJ family response regulator
MQNRSDVLRAPRGLSRERTMKLRAQSRNLTGDPNLKSPLEITRFDRESNEKTKILQMSRRGFPASAIASSLKISQEKVEAVIKEAMG